MAIPFGNDFFCSNNEQRAMSEFPHYDGTRADWDSNFKITGGCTGRYIVAAEPEDIRRYYRDNLRQRGWRVTERPADAFPLSLTAIRAELRFDLKFAAAVPGYPGPADAFRDNRLRPGQILVSISGRHRD